MAVPGLDIGRVKWKDSDVQSKTARATLSFEDLGYTDVMTTRGAITTRCKKSMGWEDPTEIDPHLFAEFQMTRACRTPTGNSPEFRHRDAMTRDPWGSRAGKRSTVLQEFGAKPMKTSTECKAYINQLQKKAPFASDRRFLGGEWLYKTSTLHKSEPVPDARYLTVYEKRPLTQSRRPGPYKNSRSTRQLVELIHQHMNTRSRSTKTASRLVDDKHPLRALMKADLNPQDKNGSKGYLTIAELRNCLDQVFCVVLDDDEVKRVIEQYPSAIESSDGELGFNYVLFVKTMNQMGQAHPLGGFAGSSWGYQQEPVFTYQKLGKI